MTDLRPQIEGPAAIEPGRISPIVIPPGVNEIAFRSVLAAYTTAYRTHGREPSTEEVWRGWPRVSEQTVGELVVLPEFGDALRARGIDVEHPGLTHLQHIAVLAFADPLDRRGSKEKLDSLGVSTQQFAIWKRRPEFQAALDAQSRRLAADYAPEIRNRMVAQAEAGSFKHQEFLLEAMGEGPKARDSQNVQQLVGLFVSAIARATHGHPEIREAILSEMRGSMLSVQMTQNELPR